MIRIKLSITGTFVGGPNQTPDFEYCNHEEIQKLEEVNKQTKKTQDILLDFITGYICFKIMFL